MLFATDYLVAKCRLLRGIQFEVSLVLHLLFVLAVGNLEISGKQSLSELYIRSASMLVR